MGLFQMDNTKGRSTMAYLYIIIFKYIMEVMLAECPNKPQTT